MGYISLGKMKGRLKHLILGALNYNIINLQITYGRCCLLCWGKVPMKFPWSVNLSYSCEYKYLYI